MARTNATKPTDPEPNNDDAIDGDAAGDLNSLAALDRDDVTWYVYRLALDGRVLPPGVRAEDGLYVMRFTGRVDLDRLREELGGGFYRILGREASTGVFVHRARFGIDGPLRSPLFATPAAAVAAAASAATAPSEFAELKHELAQLRSDLAASRSSSSSGDLLKAIELGSRLGGGGGVKTNGIEVLDVLERGYKLGERAGGEGDSMHAVVRELIPIAREVVSAWGNASRSSASATPGAGPAASPNGRPPGNAVFLELLARSIARGTTPEALADAAEDLLSEGELAQLRFAQHEQLVELVRQNASGFPELLERLPGVERDTVRSAVQDYIRELQQALLAEPGDDRTGDD